MEGDTVRASLTAVKGIGNWTADMHLIFTQNRPDVFASGDVSLLFAMRDLYGLPEDCAFRGIRPDQRRHGGRSGASASGTCTSTSTRCGRRGRKRTRVPEMKSDIRHYRGNRASVTFDVPRCIHAEVCVRGRPEVFDVSRRPWILPYEGDPKRLERVVMGCPTGALRMAPPTDQKVDKGAAAAATILPAEPRKKNPVSVNQDGPYYAHGNLENEETPGAEVR